MSLEDQLQYQQDKIAQLEAKLSNYKFQIDQLRKLIYGAKSERYKAQDIPVEQGNLFAPVQEVQQEKFTTTEKVSYERRKKKTSSSPKGSARIPDHLPTREVIIEPDVDTCDMVKIGEEITETLDYTPASLTKVVTIRPKYVAKTKNTQKEPSGLIHIGSLPSRPLERSIAEASLLAHIMVSKFVDHLPFYRQIQIFKRDFGWVPPKSTISDWHRDICKLLEPLHNLNKEKLLASHYLQVDESPIKVQDSSKKGTSHQGYQWVYYAVQEGIVLFDYHRSRSIEAPKQLLKHFRGRVQCDGYGVYDKLERIYPHITLVGCWVHARRGFYKAKQSDAHRAGYALKIFSKIYHHESICSSFTAEQRKVYRQKHSMPLMLQLEKWIQSESIHVLPKSPIGKAMSYCINQWTKLMRCFEDGQLSLDNNQIENKIRPLALGRKNYLFAGSHEAAQRIAMMYGFFATCSIHNVNPREWLTYVLENIANTKLSDLEKLLPQKFIT